MPLEHYSSVFDWDSTPNYSQAVLASQGSIVFFSGQGPFDSAGAVAGNDAETQIRLTFQNLERVLAACGATVGDLMRLTVYLASPDDFDAYRSVRHEALSEPFPASTVIAATLLVEGMLVEIDAVACIRDRPSEA